MLKPRLVRNAGEWHIVLNLFLNCSKGVKGVNGGDPYCPNLAELGENGLNYLETSTSKPSDSFPGLTAIVSGGSARTEGVFYDAAYDRSLNPPITTTGNMVTGVPCTPGTVLGTRTEYEEGIDIDQTQLNGGAPAGKDGGIEQELVGGLEGAQANR